MMGWGEIHARLTTNSADGEAGEALVQRVRQLVRAQFRQRDTDAQEDAIGETCTAVLGNLRRAYGPLTFAGFVYGEFLNVRRRMVNNQRRLVTSSFELLDIARFDDRPSHDELLSMWHALDELPTRHRRALLLRYMEDAPATQIAAELATTPGNARRIVCTALAQVRRRLRDADRA
jgi:RNA polymerase sigma factor (sigma-70 family)